MGKYTFVRNLNGTNATPATIEVPVAATQTLVAGDLLVLASGKASKAGASTARVLGVMAQDSASQAVDTDIKIYPIVSGQVWRTTADADASALVFSADRTVDINATTQTVDVADTTNGCIQVIDADTAGTTVEIVFTARVFD